MIVVTGAAGFIGSCLLWQLNKAGIEDIVAVDILDNTEKWRNLTGKRFKDYFQKDEFLSLVLEEKLPKPKAIFHIGACSSTTLLDADYFIKNNYEYSKTLAKWAFKHGAYFFYASSAATYGNGEKGYNDNDDATPFLMPLNMYGYSKLLFDNWILNETKNFTDSAKKVTGFRFFNVFGPNEYHKADMMSVVCKTFNSARYKGRIQLFKSYKPEYADGEQKRDFVYVKDVVMVMNYFFNNPVRGIFNLGTGASRTWNDLARAVFKALGKASVIEYIDMPEYLRPKYQYFTQANLDNLRNIARCAHKFMSLEDAIKDYAGYLKNNDYL
ncbi:ADP-L-glycero-D-manno-heptose-6-epimerase [Candidatus Omnitrophus magneticus]|uniref:ADP-L-glycero-D-manno-heptose-6-epimerase n=1 Tax=Candidatus Omnitrophus magneticus TaxID=1609969 RepID=A0A0F0CMA5_9BACT|nr:ADP-L-glycero-D-manno-heptose-6-epimerase [Candidatus Omnitrophus magneticus]